MGKCTYRLNAEVENPPKALQIASQIGILNFENPEMKNLENKDAIIVLAFGTTCKETREKTIEATVQAIQDAHKNIKVVTAFTSHIVIKHIKKREGKCNYLTPEETLDNLKREGFTRIEIVPLTLIPGIEYKYNVMLFHEYKTQFKKMTLATSLMYWQGQKNHPDDIAEVISSLDFPQQNKDTAILLMAHGTPDPSDAFHSVIQEKILSLGREDVFVYTVEGSRTLENLIDKLKNSDVKKIILMPLMLVAGVHVLEDMSGNEKNSHKSILENAGFEVETILKGLGENKKIRELYVKRTNDAWDALTN